MIRLKKGAQAPSAAVPLKMGRGVTFMVRPLDAIALYTATGEVVRDIEAMRAGRDTRYPWALTEGEIAGLEDSPAVRAAVGDYMRNVLQAVRGVERLEGVFDEETGEPWTAGFDAFSVLMRDALFATAWSQHVVDGFALYEAEKNVSGRAPDGPGDQASIIAQGAAPQENHAQTAGASASSTANGADALSTNTRPEPSSAPPSGTSPSPGDAGSAPAPLELSSD